MQCFSTTTVAPRERLAYWNECVGDVQVRMQIAPVADEVFSGDLHFDTIGDVEVSTAASSQAVLQRTARHIAHDERRLFRVSLAMRGEFTLRQRGRESVVHEGDFSLTDSAEPFSMHHHAACTAGVLGVPEVLMRRHFPLVDDVSGRAVSGLTARGAVAVGALRALYAQMERGRCTELEPVAVEHVVGLVASALAAQFGTVKSGGSAVAFRRADLRRYVEAHLPDPALTVMAVARRFRLSERYLCLLFADEGETMSAYIRRRRLEECARRLADPLWRGRSVSEIAMDWGFNSLGSFDRAFKQHFGVTPHGHRSTALAGAAAGTVKSCCAPG